MPSSLQPVLERATALDPNARYGSAAELKAAFLKAMSMSTGGGSGGDSIHEEASEQPDGVEPVRKSSRLGARALAIGLGVLAVAAIFALAFSGGLHQDESARGTAVSQSVEKASSAASANSGEGGGTQADASSRASSHTSSAGNASEGSTSGAAEKSGQSAGNAAVSDMHNGAPLRDDFNPETNIPVTIAGLTFRIPRCFTARVSQNDSGMTYYYAESGSTLAMIMSGEVALAAGEGGSTENTADGEGASDAKEAMDGFLAGVMKSDSAFDELIGYTDYDLAGRPARIATFRGTAKDLPETTKALFFYDQDASVMGVLFFGQTDNAQFDYSEDFAKTLASATAAR